MREIEFRALLLQYKPETVAQSVVELSEPVERLLIPVNELPSSYREWHYGYLIEVDRQKGHCIIKDDRGEHYCYLETLGQYINVKDGKSNKLFAGDIVNAKSEGYVGKFEIKWRQSGSPCWILYPAWQNGEMWHISATEHKKGMQFISVDCKITTTDKEGFYDDGLEKIGNIYENPELKEGK